MSTVESEPSSSPPPEPAAPERVPSKQPPIPFIRGEDRVRKMLPQRKLPHCLDHRFVDVRTPNNLPLYWLGVPMNINSVARYANEHGFAIPRFNSPPGSDPGVMSMVKTWGNIIEHFYREHGTYIKLKEVWDARTLIIAFFSNREVEDITFGRTRPIRQLLEDLGYGENEPLMWYLDRDEDSFVHESSPDLLHCL
ncbi:hypothetical protein DICSQDRAFT_172911 [Dichomitus squalens LYAD-421 SS1]|uniref:Uncharacterized protein n=2 Tax=Dichomitus squalens TaxID=114155 RepID=A0A4Q9M835_9APHY|nr:uncharacterized protein DICSQDRAFT_172911 [Dichomitus squalens LYAD-421 SS1]EJF58560.1 hypothetical protein DICSQDRAFT_172911 [Dichomitus squalens LYAD-421 SS1]TBU23109.1 hypothetical protein BD311DRAFT_674628 [Dichomitus squalens]